MGFSNSRDKASVSQASTELEIDALLHAGKSIMQA